VTRLIAMVEAISNRLGVEPPAKSELQELKQDVEPQIVLSQIEEAERRRNAS
jgi:hypothetical protein